MTVVLNTEFGVFAIDIKMNDLNKYANDTIINNVLKDRN